MRGVQIQFHVGAQSLLLASGKPSGDAFHRVPEAHARQVLVQAVRCGRLGSTLYQLWRAHERGASHMVTAADYECALRWALQQLGPRGRFAVYRRELPRAGFLNLPAPPVLPRPPEPTVDDNHWIQLDVMDQRDECIAGAPYRLGLAEETVSEGLLGPYGSVYLDRIKPGGYRATLAHPETPSPQGEWLVIDLVDTEGEPMAGERYHVVDSASNTFEGALGDNGRAVLQGIIGPCSVSFPELMEVTHQE